MTIKKFFFGLAVVAMAVGFAAPVAHADAVSDLMAQIAALQAQIAALSGGSSGSSSCTFTRSLAEGMSGDDVKCLQGALGVSPASGWFGPITKAAVASWQAAHGVSPAAGYFGPISMAAWKASMGGSTGSGLPAGCTSSSGFSTTTGMSCSGGSSLPAGCTSTSGFSSTTGAKCDGSGSGSSSSNGTLEGGAGNIEDVDFIAGLNSEEVGEDEEDVQVAGLTIEADSGSDLELTAVNLDFDYADSGASTKFDHYASEVSLWFNDKEVARVDASEFTNDNNYTKTISLDSGSVIKAGETGDLVVAVSGISNLDSTDAGENWNVQFKSIRYKDAQGASVTDSSTGDIDNTSDENTTTANFERQFSFATFATAADTEFKITEGDTTINTGHTIVVNNTSDTEDEPILAFDVEIKGTADVHVDDLPVSIGTSNDNVDDVISGLSLWMDGERVGTANISDCLVDTDCASVGTEEPFLFDNMDLVLEGGNEYEFIVKADLYPVTGTGDLAEGQTISASTTATMIETSGYSDIEDDSGETLVAADTNGSATSDASTFYISGIFPKFVSSTEVTRVGTLATDPDVVDLTLVFDITAVGDDDVWVERDFATQGAVADATVDGQFWATTTDSTTGTSTSGSYAPSAPTLNASGSTSDDDTAGSDQDFKIESGQTRRFTFQVSIPAGGDNVNAGARITGIKWGTTDDDDNMNNVYTTNISDLKTRTVTGLSIH